MMGWWKPYFFLDTNGVQLLFDWAKIDGLASFLACSSALAALCLVDRFAHHYNLHKLSGSLCSSTAAWTVQRFTSGLLMLVMMSFNMVLFLEVIIFSGLAELAMRLCYRKEAEGVAFQRVQHSIEMC